MAKASKKSPEEKLRVVLSVLRGEQTSATISPAGRLVSAERVPSWTHALTSERNLPISTLWSTWPPQNAPSHVAVL